MRAAAHLLTGALLINLGEAAAAERELDQALTRFRRLGERWGADQALVARADLSSTRGRHEQAMAILEEAMEVLAGLGDREDVGQILIRTASERPRAGQMAQAEADLEAPTASPTRSAPRTRSCTSASPGPTWPAGRDASTRPGSCWTAPSPTTGAAASRWSRSTPSPWSRAATSTW